MGLLQLLPGGNAHLIPISIMVDGKLYDANAYKATPVPFALEGGTVYEAFRTGNSLGLFTVAKVAQQKDSWMAEGFFRAAGSIPTATGLKAETKPREDDDKPPTLRHADSAPKPAAAPPTAAPPVAKAPDTPVPGPTQPVPASGEAKPTSPPSSASESANDDDPDRPRLSRGKPTPHEKTASKPESKSVPPSGKTAAKASSAPAANKNGPSASGSEVQLVPAISDAGGPEPRPYTYDMKSTEEQALQKKMLAMASDEVRKQLQQWGLVSLAAPAAASRAKTSSRTLPLNFEDIKFRVFDVSTNNEPVLVLIAKTRPPARSASKGASTEPAPEYYVTLVGRVDLYGELRKLFSAVTDHGHMDVTPRMELIDAVDADGDGRGELLFRQIYDSGRAYVIYRVLADQLWPLFQGTSSNEYRDVEGR